MLSQQLRQIVSANPQYAEISPVIEKEILHHDIMDVLVKQGAMQRLTFIGGTSLRMCHNSARLSEDLDFNGGHDFKPADFDGLETEIQSYIEKKYNRQVSVYKPSAEKQGDTVSWKISIVREPNRADLTRQKMHIDVCAIPSFDLERRPLLNHYNIVVPTEGILVPVQSLAETLADKMIALAYRTRRIKPRDLWDIVWIRQRGVDLSQELLAAKLSARHKEQDDFLSALSVQITKLLSEDEVRKDFCAEMTRFIPRHIKDKTIEKPEFWDYLQKEVSTLASGLLDESKPTQFPMG